MRAARAAVLVFLGAFVALILYTVWRAPDPSPAVPPPHPVPEAPEEMPVTGPVESAAETFHFTEEKGGSVVTRLQAGKMLGIEGGSRVLSDILIELRPYPDTEPDRLARIRGDAGRFDAAAHEVVLQGNVEVRMATGEELTAPTLRYRVDERVARTDSEVGFGLEGAAGTARGLEADLVNQRLRLAENVRLEAAGEDDEPVSIAADELRFDGQAGRLHLGGAVEISGGWGVFQGREMAFETGDEQSNSGVSREPGRLEAVAGESGTLILRAESWTFEFDEARNIQGVVASGNARLEPLEPGTSPFRELKAQRIHFEPAEQPDGHQRLEAFAGEGAPVQAYLEEESLRAVTSDRLTLLVGSDDEGRATFEGDVRASGPARAATGHRLVLLEDHSAILSGSTERPARVMEIEERRGPSTHGGGVRRGRFLRGRGTPHPHRRRPNLAG
jgi:LPS export ABC transporter protein LptC